MLTKNQLAVLKLLLESRDGEFVVEGAKAYVGLYKTSPRVARALLYHMAIRDSGYSEGRYRVYVASSSAPQILNRPALADEMVRRVVEGKPFYVDDAGVIQDA